MLDAYGRKTEYLRLSVTEKCNLSCIYCKSKLCANPTAELSADEFGVIIQAAVSLGMTKLRLTGGEPLRRRDLERIIASASTAGFKEISLTTNAQGFSKRAADLKAAGLNRINISADSLDAEKYRRITDGGELNEVFSAIDTASSVGLLPIKLNVVAMRGVNDDEILEFAKLAKHRDIDVRFIELMPIGPLNSRFDMRISQNEILSALPKLRRIPPRYSASPSVDYTADGFLGRIGFISPLSCRFCSQCNRIRITSDGYVMPCLGHDLQYDLKPALSLGTEAVKEIILTAVSAKPQGHEFCTANPRKRQMYQIGG